MKIEESKDKEQPPLSSENSATNGPTADNSLEQRRQRAHNKIIEHFGKKVSKSVFNSQPHLIKRSEVSTTSVQRSKQGSLEKKVFNLYQILEDLEMELMIANSKIRSYFMGLGARVHNIRRELRSTMDDTDLPRILANYDDRQRSNKNLKGSNVKSRATVRRKGRRSIRFSKKFHSSDSNRQNSSNKTTLNSKVQRKSCLKHKVTDDQPLIKSAPKRRRSQSSSNGVKKLPKKISVP